MTFTKQEINKRYNEKKRKEKINKTFILNDGETSKEICNNEKYYLTNQGRSTICCSFLKPIIGNEGYIMILL